jgi:predicted HicB family RNase H-like nuclease
MLELAQHATQEERIRSAHRIASEKFAASPDWVAFYREVLGVDGIEYAEIQQMVAKLRTKIRGQKQQQSHEPTRVITVRLPQSLHEALRHEAHNHQTSMNKLCISKLLQVIGHDLIPPDFERREEEEDEGQSSSAARVAAAFLQAQSSRPTPTPASAPPTVPFTPHAAHGSQGFGSVSSTPGSSHGL